MLLDACFLLTDQSIPTKSMCGQALVCAEDGNLHLHCNNGQILVHQHFGKDTASILTFVLLLPLSSSLPLCLSLPLSFAFGLTAWFPCPCILHHCHLEEFLMRIGTHQHCMHMRYKLQNTLVNRPTSLPSCFLHPKAAATCLLSTAPGQSYHAVTLLGMYQAILVRGCLWFHTYNFKEQPYKLCILTPHLQREAMQAMCMRASVGKGLLCLPH